MPKKGVIPPQFKKNAKKKKVSGLVAKVRNSAKGTLPSGVPATFKSKVRNSKKGSVPAGLSAYLARKKGKK